MTPGKLNVLVVDDHALVRYGIRRLLREEPDIDVIGEASTASEALVQVRANSWDVVVMDLDMPGQDALEVLHLMRLAKPDLPILILTLYSEAQYGMRSLRAGASGYLTKGSAPDDLVVAIRKVVEGGAYVSPALALQLANRLKYGAKETLHELLSNRELTVLCAIARGKQLAQIAAELHLSAKTVTTYRTRVLEKLGKRSNAELALYAAEHGLIAQPQVPERYRQEG